MRLLPGHGRHVVCSLLEVGRNSPLSQGSEAARFAANGHMMPSVNGSGDFAGSASPARWLDREAAVRALSALQGWRAGDDQLNTVLESSFHAALLDALSQIPEKSERTSGAAASPAGATLPIEDPPGVRHVENHGGTAIPDPIAPLPAAEDALIREAATRAAIDPRLLSALRRAENGAPGREFGVLSVPAPTYADQVRLAAGSIRRSLGRFEATGRAAIDPATGRYTDEFIRFFSNRYAPVAAANDPTGLNRHHSRNLLRLYAQIASTRG